MPDSARTTLLHYLTSSYDDLKRRLTRRLGSAETATEALHETYLRIGNATELGQARDPAKLLYRIALNVAMDGYRTKARWLRRSELEALQHENEDVLTPERVAEARSEIITLEAVLAEMPEQRRAIFMTALIEDVPYRTVAARFGVTVRFVEREVRRALVDASVRLDKKLSRRAGRPSRETSLVEEDKE
jgi:RNA polymerase sigma-70 factor (ECF subfamily)